MNREFTNGGGFDGFMEKREFGGKNKRISGIDFQDFSKSNRWNENRYIFFFDIGPIDVFL